MVEIIKGIFLHFSYFAILLPLGVALAWWRHFRFPFSILAIFVVASFLLEGIMYATATFLHTNNLWLVHLYAVVEFLFLSALYYRLFLNPWVRRLILLMAGLVPVAAGLEAFGFGSLTQFNTFTLTLAGLLLIVYALFYFDRVFRELRVNRLDKDPVFLVSAGSMLYRSGTILGYMFMNTLLAHSLTMVWTIYLLGHGLNIIFKICLALALWHAARQEKEKQTGAGPLPPDLPISALPLCRYLPK